MKITNISYEKCHNLGNYEHEKIRLDAEVSEGDDVAEAMTTLRTIVEADNDARMSRLARNRAANIPAAD